jgi:hypothetical protein
MKAKVIIFLALFAVGCATTSSKKFNERVVEIAFDKAWKDYWVKDKNRLWPKGFGRKDVKKVRSDCCPKSVPARNFGKIRR